MRRRVRRGEMAAGVGGGVLQLLPLLEPDSAGSEAGAQPPEQQGQGGGHPGPHRRRSAQVRDDGVRGGVLHGLHLPHVLDRERGSDPARAAVVQEPAGGAGGRGALWLGVAGSTRLHDHFLVCF